MENIDEEATTRAQAIPDVAQQLVVFRRYDSKGDSMINKRVAHHLRQIPSWGARDRQWVASLSLEPEELERLGHIKFQEGKDDLAALKYVFLELDGGPQLLLLKYENPHARDAGMGPERCPQCED